MLPPEQTGNQVGCAGLEGHDSVVLDLSIGPDGCRTGDGELEVSLSILLELYAKRSKLSPSPGSRVSTWKPLPPLKYLEPAGTGIDWKESRGVKPHGFNLYYLTTEFSGLCRIVKRRLHIIGDSVGAWTKWVKTGHA